MNTIDLSVWDVALSATTVVGLGWMLWSYGLGITRTLAVASAR